MLECPSSFVMIVFCCSIWLIVFLHVRPTVEDSENYEKLDFGNHNDDQSRCNKQHDSSEVKDEEPPCQEKQKMDDDELIFKNPEFILGKSFNSTVAKTVCESRVYTRGNKVECIQFTRRGVNTCMKVCSKQDQKILRVSPTVVVLADGYCTKKRLKPATCVCVYKVTCREYKHFVFVHFIPNTLGEMAMLYKDCGHPLSKPL